MTYQQAAETAIAIQDASNLSGVVHSFAEAVDAIWEQARDEGEGTRYVNQHPIVTMFIDKLASLNRTQCLCSQNMDNFYRAYHRVESIVQTGQKESAAA